MTKATIRLADIAKAAGVSQGTASNVFSRPEIVREEVRQRVLAVAKELGYHGPDMKGRLLRAGRVNAIGIAAVEPLTYFFGDPWARALMTAIGEACDTRGAGIALVSALNQQKLAWNINSALVDGFILLCVEGGEKLVELTRQRQLPFIALSLDADEASIPAICVDNRAGGVLAARHLAEQGHRHFAILAHGHTPDHLGPLTPWQILHQFGSGARDRTSGYCQALAEFGIDPQTVPIYGVMHAEPDVTACLEALFSAPQPPTAILAMSDRIALAAMAGLAARGLTVPGDVSIVGFDGVPEAGLAKPGLTTVTQPYAAIASRAVSAILDTDVPTARQTLRQTLPVSLTLRGSTAPPS